MNDFWKHAADHLPFVIMATNGGVRVDWNQLVGAILVGGIAALGGSMLTTARLDERVNSINRDLERVSQSNGQIQQDYRMVLDRLVYCESRLHPQKGR